MKQRADLACLAILVAANPILLSFGAGVLHVDSPDAIAYATLGKEMVTNAALYIASWGHVDVGLILPPVFPLLIGLGSFFSDDLLRLASWISSASLILAAIPFALLIRESTGRIIAVVAALLIPIGSMFLYAFAPLTEALFVLLIALALVGLCRAIKSGETRSTVATGLLCGLAFLTRPVGLFLLAFVLIWVAATAAVERRERGRSIARQLAAVLAGFLLVSGPWAIALFSQTGQHPLERTFRMGTYSVSSEDPVVRGEIRQIREASEKGDYGSIYRGRRSMRKLLPDATEMYLRLAPSSSDSDVERSGVEKTLHKIVTQPFAVFGRLLGNTRSLQQISGIWLFTLFVITTLTPLLTRRKGPPWPRRTLLSAWVWFYILSISLITDLISRYVVVVLPFLLLHVAMELHALASMVPVLRVPWRRTVLCAALLIPAANPSLIPIIRASVRNAYTVAPGFYAPLREHIQEGDAVFAPGPLDAFLLGAGFRILPDDTLEKVAAYARHTGVKWLVVSRSWHNGRQIELYDHQWYAQIHRMNFKRTFPDAEHPPIVKCCDVASGVIELYEFPDYAERGDAEQR
jgi:hypothetical protein